VVGFLFGYGITAVLRVLFWGRGRKMKHFLIAKTWRKRGDWRHFAGDAVAQEHCTSKPPMK